MTLVKICGITREEDLLAAVDVGADAIGLNFFPASPRFLDVSCAHALALKIPATVWKVGLFVDAAADGILRTAREVGLDTIQLLYQDTIAEEHALVAAQSARLRTILVRRLDEHSDLSALKTLSADHLLLDVLSSVGLGGTGHQIPEPIVEQLQRMGLLQTAFFAGGLTPENVGAKVARLNPFGVDVASGVENSPGIKSADKMRRFVTAAKR